MGRSHHDEIERKYDVDGAVVFPDLAETDGVGSVGQPQTYGLEAVYFDTPGLDLARRGLTLRRRTGGYDDGWHLKLPAGPDTRTELGEPLGATREVPETFLARVRSIARVRPLEPVATVSTDRREYPLVDSAGSVLALVSDDRVRARHLDDPEGELVWREWEVELKTGPRSLLDAVGERLLGAGASPASVSSKLARVIGELPADSSAPRSTSGGAEVTVEQVLSAELEKHLARLLEQDAGVRADEAEAVHRMRIAARRLRSTLTTFRPMLDTSVTDPVRVELRWLGESFATARDAQVLREHLGAVLDSEPPELVVGSVRARLDDELSAEFEAGRVVAKQALDSDRFIRLLDAIDALIASPPLRSYGHRAAKKAMPGLLARDVKRLARAVRAIEDSDDPADRDHAFHEARKKAKRLRYAAESAASVLGHRARALARDTKEIQQTLGIHQDTVVARGRLRELGMRAHLDGENAFTVGRLHALEQARAERAEAEFAVLWARFSAKHVKRWTK
ncbi:CYTH and CHAD domain-containing protein [Terrabacter sp. LjRoot27]|uniref:CYTH and CHAD domain-containing protein n=1 Tax=Terrabacter sp. LjRoot27 TaxID=3342306 RepID=UPI003ED04553